MDRERDSCNPGSLIGLTRQGKMDCKVFGNIIFYATVRLCVRVLVMLAREVRPGVTYFVTRRCVERIFLLRPSRNTNGIVAYCLAEAASRTGVEIHAFCAMSNHIHAVLTDVRGNLPEFMALFARHITLAINSLLGRKEPLWVASQGSRIELGDAEAVLEKMVYVLANPTEAGLVEQPQDWPGFMSGSLGMRETYRRPSHYFSRSGSMPDVASIEYSVPPQLRDLGQEKANKRLGHALQSRVQAAQRRIRREGRRFLGVKAVKATPTSDSPSTPEKRVERVCRWLAEDPRIRNMLAERWKAFTLAYKGALDQWRSGVRQVVFPRGTWQMPRIHRVLCVQACG